MINQNNYHDDQNNIIDIEKIYNNYIVEIDAMRSHSNISNTINGLFLKTLDVGTLSKIASLIKLELVPQESRCHTFFRLIGFPVLGNSFDKYYNPGHDIIQDKNRKITLDFKLDITNNPMEKFREISFDREMYLNDFLTTFSQEGSITASVLALTSTEVRKFNSSFANDDPFDMDKNNQKYIANLFGRVGSKKMPLSEFIDKDGIKPDLIKLKKDRFHYIKPFLVDPRIDFSVYPIKNRVAVPFVKEKNELLISESTYVKRPLIEKIIRSRLTVSKDEDSIGTKNKEIKDYILSFESIKDEALIKQMTGNDIYKTSAFLQFNYYFNIIRSICVELVNAQQTIKKIQSKYYWLPSPSNVGPEKGSKVKNVILSQKVGSDFIGSSDLQLLKVYLKQFGNSFNSQVKEQNDSPDVGNFSLGNFELTFDGTDTDGFGDAVSDTVDNLSKIRENDLNEANKALRKIEIIMGEFSGLGLCDILVIIASLYIMPEEDLIGFLDTDAFDRMVILLHKQNDGLSNPGIKVAADSFSKTTRDFYNLIDKIYQDVSVNNQLV